MIFNLYFFKNCFLMQYLRFGLSKLHIRFFQLLINALYRGICFLMKTFFALNYRVLGFIELFSFFISIMEDSEVGSADNLRIYIFLSDLRFNDDWLRYFHTFFRDAGQARLAIWPRAVTIGIDESRGAYYWLFVWVLLYWRKILVASLLQIISVLYNFIRSRSMTWPNIR